RDGAGGGSVLFEGILEEFPAALEEGASLPVSPLSRNSQWRSCMERKNDSNFKRLHNMYLSLCLFRGASPRLGALLCQAAYSQLLQTDLLPYQCPEEPEGDQEEKADDKAVLFQSEAVQRTFLNKLIDVALAWHRNFPKVALCPSRNLQCSIHAIKNTRRKMEDRHLALAEFNQLFGIQDDVDRAYYAVFDGHGGVDAATYASTHLHVVLSKQEMLQSDATTAFKTAFKRTDDMFRNKAKRERLRSGSTGVAVLIQDQELTVAWLGDSQAILVRDGHVVRLMDPHKPEREDEKQRIEDLGGCITFMGCWRVNGTYAVSRAIGDFDQKPFVSGDAESLTMKLQGDEDYVLLACDGFFDAVKASAVPHLVMDALKLDDVGARVAQQLVGNAKTAGSSDNITVMVVFLRPPEQLLAQ
uniref:Protein phosphatase 1E n=1 Tax=Maylandia zebra TaxID=106582 RepID=A0A3P9B7L3_9CICH